MKIAITGSEGQLGSELCRQLGIQAVPLDLPDFELTDRQRVLEILINIAPQAVVNTAAFTQVDKAEEAAELCRAVNAHGVAHLVDACRQIDSILVQISTDYVFPGDATPRRPYRETDAPGPQSVYARSKLQAERHTVQWRKHFVVRTCGLYGRPGPRSAGNFVETMLDLAARKKPLRVVCDQRSTPSYVPHVARAILFLLRSGAYGTYHVVNLGETTWYDFALEVFRLAELDVDLEPITSSQYAAAALRPSYSVLDTAKYHSLPGRPAMPHWRDALAEYVQARPGRPVTPSRD